MDWFQQPVFFEVLLSRSKKAGKASLWRFSWSKANLRGSEDEGQSFCEKNM